jgi:hypothetical protein
VFLCYLSQAHICIKLFPVPINSSKHFLLKILFDYDKLNASEDLGSKCEFGLQEDEDS